MKPYALLLFPLAISICSPAHPQSLPDKAGKALTDVTTGVANILGSILSPVESEFRDAEKDGRLDDALVIYEKNEDSLKRDKDLAPQVKHVLDYAREKNRGKLVATTEAVKASLSSGGFLTDFLSLDAAVDSLLKAKEGYLASAKIIRTNIANDPALNEADALLGNVKTEVHANESPIYARFPHERKKMSSLFQAGLPNEPTLFKANWDSLSKRLAELSDSDAKKFLSNTADGWAASTDIRSEIAAALWKRTNTHDDDAVGAYLFATRLPLYGLTPADWKASPKIIAIDAASKAESPLQVTGASIIKTSAVDAFGSNLDLPNEPTVVVYLNESISRRRIVDKKEVESQFRSGSRAVPNPDYSIAEMDCRRAQSDLAAQRARNTIAPARGWGAVLQGVAEGLTAANVDQICNRFAATAPTVQEDVFERYTYTVSDVEITKGVHGYAVSIGGEGRLDAAPVALEQKEVVKVAYGRKDSDRTPSQGLLNDAAMEKLANTPLTVDVQKVVLGLSPNQRQPRTRVDAIALLKPAPQAAGLTMYASANGASGAPSGGSGTQPVSYNERPAQFAQATDDVRLSSVVVVLNPKGSIGAGFYVAPTDILTNYHVIEGASVIELRGLDGQLFSGRVVKKDIGTDIALIRVEHVGQPVQFAQSILRSGETVEAIGHPKGLFFSVSRGVVSAVRQMKGLLASGSDKALVIQTDTAINPGNSGGPLFVKDRVVGMNTVKMKGAEGIGFAIHYSELLRFLSE